MIDIASLNFEKGGGFVTVVAQDAATDAVLMVAQADRQAVERTLQTGEMFYFSRSRGLWHKGATSGNTQRVVSLAADCDGDAILARIEPRGPACHTGQFSCFGNDAIPHDVLRSLDQTISDRAASLRPAGGEPDPAAPRSEPPSYTKRLLADRNLRLKKIGEEAGELIAACADSDSSRAVEEAADLVYHVAVALSAVGSSLQDVRDILAARAARPTPRID